MNSSPDKNLQSKIFSKISQTITSAFNYISPTPSKKNEGTGTPLEVKFINFLSQQEALKGLNSEDIVFFSQFVTVEEYPQGVNIVEEGENSRDIYFIFKGTVSLLKWDHQKVHQLSIGSLGEGEIFGEMSFIDGESRSTSVQGLTAITTLKFDPENLHKINFYSKELYDVILHNIAETSIRRLRSSNQDYVKSLRSRVEFGYFFLISMILFGLVNISYLLATEYKLNSHTPLFSWTTLLSLLVPYLFLLHYFKLPLREFGVTTKNIKKSTIKGLLISFFIIVSLIFGYWIKTIYNPGSKPLLEAILNPSVPFTVFDLLYFFHSYLQEFMARGINQGSLQKFLNDKKGYKALIITSVMFGVFHLSRGLEAALTAIFGSLFFGAIYIQYYNLMGVSIVHYVVGIIIVNYLTLI